MKKIAVILSCEHAVDTVPPSYQNLFSGYQDLLLTHRAIDFGALTIAKQLSQALHCDLVEAKATRLLIDCNRSLSHPHCFSEVTSSLSTSQKEVLIDQYYLPFRQQVESLIQQKIKKGLQVWHLSIHSFVPELNGQIRNTDLGFLYDPKRVNEKKLAKSWKNFLEKQHAGLKIRMNYPYLGISDGFTTSLRKKFPNSDYLGLEIETNQKLIYQTKQLKRLTDQLSESLKKLLFSHKVYF